VSNLQYSCNVKLHRVVAAVALVGILSAGNIANAAAREASAASVEQSVIASNAIRDVPQPEQEFLESIPKDQPSRFDPRLGHCFSFSAVVKQCIAADRRSRSTIVLLGDSHAWMWAPAVEIAANALHLRLVLMWHPSCPQAATPPASNCTLWKTHAYEVVQAMHPIAVLLAERTTTDASHLSNEGWTTSVAQVLRRLRSSVTHVAIIGDSPLLPMSPAQCLSIHPTNVQLCGVPRSGGLGLPRDRSAEERSAVLSVAGTSFIDSLNWLCYRECSPIIGPRSAYFDAAHISGTYSAHLGGVMTEQISKILDEK